MTMAEVFPWHYENTENVKYIAMHLIVFCIFSLIVLATVTYIAVEPKT